ncbi:MAG: tRNA (guanosine(37)-N1)-methyltransferase TrmD [Gammaproteobacteria bacterium]|nr:tRNA (guanosine(37)-N1)-methyltransferase TrmD [Gammaproteobacteria bacterium]|tara:strand:+ start:164 stop:916 length:753 start_codon:yes stop_codon:yes gene_type:complete
MWFGIVSLFPEMFSTATSSGVLGRAVSAGVLDLSVFNPRDFTRDRHRTVDDRPYGGGPGMVMMVEPLLATIDAARAAAPAPARVVYLSPQGRRLDQARVRELAAQPALILLAGRYEGIDERVVDAAVDEELSIGDYVLTGGELPAMVVLDAVSRHLPGTLGNAASSVEESHLDGLLDYPHYTRPEIAGGRAVPPVLLTGDHAAVQRWRRQQALRRTWERRPDLLVGRDWSAEDRALLAPLLSAGTQESND